MESTYTSAQATSTEKKHETPTSNDGKVSKAALKVFIGGAGIVFGIAVYYCYSTGHKVEAGLLAGAFCLIGLFASSVYKSFK